MGSELIFRGHEADQHVADTYSPKRPKPWASVTRPFQYLLREQRLVFILVGIAIATVGFTLLPSSTPRSPYASSNVPISNYVRYDFDSSATTQYKPAYERRFGLNSWGSSGKVPLGLKRKGLRIVVTGGAGFVGSHLVDRLIARGDSVIVVDNFFTGRKENVMHHFGNPRFELIRHDVVEPLLLEVDQIYHLACPASPVHYKFNPVKTIISFATTISFNWYNSHFLRADILSQPIGLNFEFSGMHKTNVVGTLNMLGLAKRIGARFLLTSTSEVYGDPLQHPQVETYWGNVNPIGVRSCYDEGKRTAETLTMDYHRGAGVEVRIARIFNTYGPRMCIDDGRVVSNFVAQVNCLYIELSFVETMSSSFYC
ncbi:UDP-glucuronic acid decarboxylase 2-like [Pyrus ussuriensis x Pyrus communis]|uniref:UDP-glucuronate decarboxylase n=1 Tax=Pyrus ussuriensis x Pyrus communis TaxID=2448454 RepID=A0A5N5FPN4_9ROSA|nr:UDP-glucuronic acid decarboxylase 2-like [Pyrus ussuriensis x Pyrus communis]